MEDTKTPPNNNPKTDNARKPLKFEAGPKKRYQNSKELLLNVVNERLNSLRPSLSQHFTGKLVVSLSLRENYQIDWSQPKFEIKVADSPQGDTVIEISDVDLMKVASGVLNPQIAMLSHKIYVKGNTEPAVYFFNLVAPQQN